MANIISKPFKNSLKMRYALRIVAALFFALALALVIGATIAIPSLLGSRAQLQETLQQRGTNATIVDGDTYESLLDDVESINERLANVTDVDTRNKAVLINEVIKTKQQFSESIYIKSMQYTKAENKKEADELRVVGLAANRAMLSLFAEALRSSELFATVNLPLEDLAGNDSTPFTIVITL